MRWTSWLAVGLGLWLILAPFALGYADTGSGWSDASVGLTIAIMGAWAALTGSAIGAVTLSSIVGVAGLWIAISPFVFIHLPPDRVVRHEVIVGVAVVALGVARALGPGLKGRANEVGGKNSRTDAGG